MDKLLPYYEQELAFLRQYSGEFSARFPKIAGQLHMSGEVCEDPHVERLIQSVAFLNARVSKRLDDDYAQFTESLLEVLYPNFLRPFPSCSIVKFDASGVLSQLASSQTIPRGTRLRSRPIQGVNCTFSTVYDVKLSPLAINHAVFLPIPDAPEHVTDLRGASSRISVTFTLDQTQLGLESVAMDSLRVYLEGDTPFVAMLKDCLWLHASQAFVELDHNGVWHSLTDWPLKRVGFEPEEALIESEKASQAAYRLLTEYFTFPEKFNFIDIDLRGLSKWRNANHKQVTFHLLLKGIRPDSHQSRALVGLKAQHFQLHCTPVINLFKKPAEPIRLTHTVSDYPILVDARRASSYEVFKVERVSMVRQSPNGEQLTEFKPFYAARDGAISDQRYFWMLRRDEFLAEISLGYETRISVVDADLNPALLEQQTLSIDLLCTNRDLPSQLLFGVQGGDLFLENGTLVKQINFLKKPTPTYRFANENGMHWRLISQLSLNQHTLFTGGVNKLREVLQMYNIANSPSCLQQIQGLAEMKCSSTQAWLSGNPFPSMVKGSRIDLTLNLQSFVGSSVDTFVSVVDRFLGVSTHANSFTQLHIYAQQNNESLLSCAPRCGDQAIL